MSFFGFQSAQGVSQRSQGKSVRNFYVERSCNSGTYNNDPPSPVKSILIVIRHTSPQHSINIVCAHYSIIIQNVLCIVFSSVFPWYREQRELFKRFSIFQNLVKSGVCTSLLRTLRISCKCSTKAMTLGYTHDRTKWGSR